MTRIHIIDITGTEPAWLNDPPFPGADPRAYLLPRKEKGLTLAQALGPTEEQKAERRRKFEEFLARKRAEKAEE